MKREITVEQAASLKGLSARSLRNAMRHDKVATLYYNTRTKQIIGITKSGIEKPLQMRQKLTKAAMKQPRYHFVTKRITRKYTSDEKARFVAHYLLYKEKIASGKKKEAKQIPITKYQKHLARQYNPVQLRVIEQLIDFDSPKQLTQAMATAQILPSRLYVIDGHVYGITTYGTAKRLTLFATERGRRYQFTSVDYLPKLLDFSRVEEEYPQLVDVDIELL